MSLSSKPAFISTPGTPEVPRRIANAYKHYILASEVSDVAQEAKNHGDFDNCDRFQALAIVAMSEALSRQIN